MAVGSLLGAVPMVKIINNESGEGGGRICMTVVEFTGFSSFLIDHASLA